MPEASYHRKFAVDLQGHKSSELPTIWEAAPLRKPWNLFSDTHTPCPLSLPTFPASGGQETDTQHLPRIGREVGRNMFLITYLNSYDN